MFMWRLLAATSLSSRGDWLNLVGEVSHTGGVGGWLWYNCVYDCVYVYLCFPHALNFFRKPCGSSPDKAIQHFSFSLNIHLRQFIPRNHMVVLGREVGRQVETILSAYSHYWSEGLPQVHEGLINLINYNILYIFILFIFYI